MATKEIATAPRSSIRNDGPSSTEATANSVFDDIQQGPFSYKDLARMDEALTLSSRETGLRFTLYIGELEGDTRAAAEQLHARSGGDTSHSVLIALSPGQRVLEVVTGQAAARRLPDRACALAVLAMTNTLSSGDLVGAVVNGLRQLSDSAGHPAAKRH